MEQEASTQGITFPVLKCVGMPKFMLVAVTTMGICSFSNVSIWINSDNFFSIPAIFMIPVLETKGRAKSSSFLFLKNVSPSSAE